MKKFIPMLLIAASLFFTSCGASKFFSGNASNIDSITLVSPYAYLTDAFGEWQTNYVDAPSQLNQQLISEVVGNIGLPVKKSASIDYKSDVDAANWMRHLSEIGAAGAKRQEVPAQIVDAVKKSGSNYGLLITDVGFCKSENQLEAEAALETSRRVVDLLKNGNLHLYDDTKAYKTGVYSLIFDSNTGKPVWFGSIPRGYKNNPTDRESIIRQMERLFKDFLK